MSVAATTAVLVRHNVFLAPVVHVVVAILEVGVAHILARPRHASGEGVGGEAVRVPTAHFGIDHRDH